MKYTEHPRRDMQTLREARSSCLIQPNMRSTVQALCPAPRKALFARYKKCSPLIRKCSKTRTRSRPRKSGYAKSSPDSGGMNNVQVARSIAVTLKSLLLYHETPRIFRSPLPDASTSCHRKTKRTLDLDVGLRRLTAWQVPHSSRSAAQGQKKKRQLSTRSIMRCVTLGEFISLIGEMK